MRLEAQTPGGLGNARPWKDGENESFMGANTRTIDLVGYGVVSELEEHIASSLDLIKKRLADLMGRVEPMGIIREETQRMSGVWKRMEESGMALTEKASQIYYDLDTVSAAMGDLQSLRDDMQQLSRSTLPLHVIQENVVQAAERLRNMDPKRFETLARALGQSLATRGTDTRLRRPQTLGPHMWLQGRAAAPPPVPELPRGDRAASAVHAEAQLTQISSRQKEITEQAEEILELKRRIR